MKRMNIFEHLEELRRRLFICAACLFAGSFIGFFFVSRVIAWISRPVGHLYFMRPAEAFIVQFKVSFGVSFLITLPVLIYQAWAFLSTGLKDSEKKYLRWMVPSAYVLFMTGAALSAFVVFPRAINFLLTLGTQEMRPMLSVEFYYDFFALLLLAFGVLFQLPLLLHLLAKMGLLRPEVLTKNRRITYLALFIIATICNPVPEVFTQVLLGCSAIILFELSILLVRWEYRKQQELVP